MPEPRRRPPRERGWGRPTRGNRASIASVRRTGKGAREPRRHAPRSPASSSFPGRRSARRRASCYMGAVRKLFTLGILLTLALPGVASALPAPARLGDLSFGLGPAFVVDRGEALGGVTGETNLLFGLFSLGVHGRVAQGRGDLHAAVGV